MRELSAIKADSATIGTSIVMLRWTAMPVALSATSGVFATSGSTLKFRHPAAPSSATEAHNMRNRGSNTTANLDCG